MENDLGSPEVLSIIADEAINKAASHFSKGQQVLIMNEIGDIARDTNVKGLMTDLLTAIMFHLKLDTIRYETVFDGNVFPQSVEECLRDENRIVKNFRRAHEIWLSIDYRDILEWSCTILGVLPKSHNRNVAVRIIAEAAIEIQGHSGNEHHDIVGITFCQSIETARNDGSMYTTLPAAVLLSTLLFEDLEIDWSNYDDVVGLRISDFACGTGTLLIAVANMIMRMERTGRKGDVAKALIEQMVYGFDVNSRAIFQTATGLGMLAPDVEFCSMHLYSLILGTDEGGQARVGSLELLEDIGQISLIGSSVTGNRIDSENVPIEPGKIHIGILNPPYTRNSLRHHHLSASERVALQGREKELYAGTGIPHTSNANGFFVLSEKYLDKEKGRMGFVVPTAMATNPSALWTRQFLSERFHIKYLVVSYDPSRIFFSGNTSIGEMLVVLERKRDGEELPTKVVKLTANPDKASKAVLCAKDILSGRAEREGWAVVDKIDAKTIGRGDWSAVQFVSNELYRIASKGLWSTSLKNQVAIVPLGRHVRSVARRCDSSEVSATPALYNHNVEHCNKMEIEPDSFVCSKEGFGSLKNAGYLKLAERMRLTTVKNVSCRTTVPSVGSAWANVVTMPIAGVDSISVEKAIVMILNSTLGKLGMLLVRSNKILSYPQFSKDGLERIPMPRISGFDSMQIVNLATVYDMLCDQERLSLPHAHRCLVQIAIDDAVIKYLGFDRGICEKVRCLLSEEPMVTGRRYRHHECVVL